MRGESGQLRNALDGFKARARRESRNLTPFGLRVHAKTRVPE
jgi:hypothetical protein